MYNTLYAEKPDDHRPTQLLIHSLLIAITTLLLLFRYLTIFRWFGYLQWENWWAFWTATALFDQNILHSLHFDASAISESQNLAFCCDWKTLLNVNRFVQWLSWCTYKTIHDVIAAFNVMSIFQIKSNFDRYCNYTHGKNACDICQHLKMERVVAPTNP